MKFINFTIVKFSIFLVMGILTSHFFPIATPTFIFLLGLLIAVFILWFWARKQLFQMVYFGIATYLCFFAIGYFSYQIRLPQFQPQHYSHFISENNPQFIQLKITQILQPNNYYQKYIANVQNIDERPVSGQILLNISKDSVAETLIPDEVLLVYGTISEMPAPLNPHQFDYSKYMKSLGVYGELQTSTRNVISSAHGAPTLKGTAENMRSFIVQKLEATNLETQERGILQALILGERKDIDKQLYSDYVSAGVVHILSVSGLHVGVLYLILGLLLKPLKRFRHGELIQSVIIICLLWCFALLSGLSPPVARAATMFSFFALAQLAGRTTSSINTLFLSLLTLLIINPLWLFQIGFQLSYLAVFFIVWLQPKLYSLGYSKYYIVRQAWGIISVSLCAQLGVLPLSLYYFHQFPGLFLVANLVVLPVLGFLMFAGLLVMLLATFWRLPDWMGTAYNFLIEWLNKFIHWVAVQDQFLFRDIHFSELKTVGSYILIIALILLWHKFNFKRLATVLVATSAFIGIFIWDEYKASSNKLIVFQKNRQNLLGNKNGKDFVLFKNDTTNQRENFPLKPYLVAENISHYSEEKMPRIFLFNGKKILVLDSLGVYPKIGNLHTLLLSESPKVNLSRLIDSLRPKQIIADGNNYTSYVNRWKETCRTRKLPFYHTAKTGALQIE